MTKKGQRRERQVVRETVYEDRMPILLAGIWRQLKAAIDSGQRGRFATTFEGGASQLTRVTEALSELIKADGRVTVTWTTARGETDMEWAIVGDVKDRKKGPKVWTPF